MRSCPSTIDTVPSFPVNRLPAVTRTSRTFCRGERRLLFRRRYEINYGGKFSRHDEPAEGLILFVSVFIKRILPSSKENLTRVVTPVPTICHIEGERYRRENCLHFFFLRICLRSSGK